MGRLGQDHDMTKIGRKANPDHFGVKIRNIGQLDQTGKTSHFKSVAMQSKMDAAAFFSMVLSHLRL